QLGLGSATPGGLGVTPVVPAMLGATGVLDIGTGDETGCALLSSGRVKCAGWNGFGQLGDGLAEGSSATLVDVAVIDQATALTVGESLTLDHACVIQGP